MWGKHSFFYLFLTVSLSGLVFHYNSVVLVNYLPDVQKDYGGYRYEKVSLK
jgi:hypothetical protein